MIFLQRALWARHRYRGLARGKVAGASQHVFSPCPGITSSPVSATNLGEAIRAWFCFIFRHGSSLAIRAGRGAAVT
ncbi:hypothetical protein HMPREF0578_1781 [Mobiluncus mulieris 28-1]|nr:hypothetical protein HMPREF0578_1781 [Mobiluncus mulieris 28-1]